MVLAVKTQAFYDVSSPFPSFFQVIWSGLTYFLYKHSLVGFGMLACLIEVNSVFLHSRMLILMYGYPKTSLIFRVNNIFNLLTYLTFRMISLIYTVKFAFEDCAYITVLWCYWFRFMALTLFVVNTILFYRLLKSDFLPKGYKSRSVDQSDPMISNNANGDSMNIKSD